MRPEALAKPLWGVCKREVRIQESGVRIIEHLARVLNTEFWLLNTALAEPTKEVLQAPHNITTEQENMSRMISKSKYLAGLQCPKLLWTHYNDKAQLPMCEGDRETASGCCGDQ
jgi:hypothetical protein